LEQATVDIVSASYADVISGAAVPAPEPEDDGAEAEAEPETKTDENKAG
jgi:hypothetical protein